MLDKWGVFGGDESGHGTSGEPATRDLQGSTSSSAGALRHETAAVKPTEYCPKCGCPRCGAHIPRPDWAQEAMPGRVVPGRCEHCGALLVYTKGTFTVVPTEQLPSLRMIVRAAFEAITDPAPPEEVRSTWFVR